MKRTLCTLIASSMLIQGCTVLNLRTELPHQNKPTIEQRDEPTDGRVLYATVFYERDFLFLFRKKEGNVYFISTYDKNGNLSNVFEEGNFGLNYLRSLSDIAKKEGKSIRKIHFLGVEKNGTMNELTQEKLAELSSPQEITLTYLSKGREFTMDSTEKTQYNAQLEQLGLKFMCSFYCKN